MYTIVWSNSETRSVGVVAAWIEGERLAMVLTVMSSVGALACNSSVLLGQNQTRKLKQDLQNIWQPWQSCRRDKTVFKNSAHSLV